MNPLIAVRSCTSGYASDLLYPAVTPSLLVRLEPGEILRWRGEAHVGETRWSADRKKWELAWELDGLIDCLITDRRLTYLGRTVKTGAGPPVAGLAPLHGQRECHPGTVLAGQVRFQWPGSVTLSGHGRDHVHCSHVTITCQDGPVLVSLVVSVKESVPAQAGELMGTGLAQALVSDIARFRVATRGRQLTAEASRNLARLADHAVPEPTGPTRWQLDGGLKIGRAADPDAYRSWLGEKRDRAAAAADAYRARGKLRDLETWLQVSGELAEDSASDVAVNIGDRNRHASAVEERFRRRGDIGDLTTAVGLHRDTAAVAREACSPELPGVLRHLGEALSNRWRSSLDDQDLADAITVLEEAAAAAGENTDEWAAATASLSWIIRASYPIRKDPADLDRAVGLCEEIRRRVPDAFSFQAALGFALLDRHRASGRAEDVRRAVDALRLSLQGSLKSDARATVEIALADATARLDASGKRSLDRVRAWRDACADPESKPPAAVLQAAQNWSAAEIGWGDWEHAIEACDAGLAAAERLLGAQLAHDHKALWLEEAAGLPARSAYAQARLGQLPEAAATLERGRAVLLSDMLSRDRADLDRLSSLGHGDLRQRYELASGQLAGLERPNQVAATRSRRAIGQRSPDDQARAVRAELDAAISAVRGVPGYASFLARPGLDEVYAAARRGPLAYIAYTEAGGLALLAEPQAAGPPALRCIWLDQLTESAVVGAATAYDDAYAGALGDRTIATEAAWHQALDTVTRWLWDTVMGPILADLGADRITLIPGGILSLFPLHAAWRTDPSGHTGRRYALDDALITYAPSAQSLPPAPSARPGADSILAVFDPKMPPTFAEAQAAVSWFDRRRCLSRDDTALTDLLAALPGHSVLHFSCHGYANLTEPLTSSLLAASDGDLTLRDILALRLPGVRLAVLSACGTSHVGMSVPDEALGLPAGLVLAGGQGVIGSLWPVWDIVTCALMTRFYDLWQSLDLEPAEALRRAQQWVRDTPPAVKRRTYPGSMSAAYAQSLDPDAHAHMVNWGAFQLVGT